MMSSKGAVNAWEQTGARLHLKQGWCEEEILCSDSWALQIHSGVHYVVKKGWHTSETFPVVLQRSHQQLPLSANTPGETGVLNKTKRKSLDKKQKLPALQTFTRTWQCSNMGSSNFWLTSHSSSASQVYKIFSSLEFPSSSGHCW